MLKVKYLLIFGIIFMVMPHVLTAIMNIDPVYKNQRRIGLKFKGSKFYDQILAMFNNKNDFFDNFFNVNGKEHDREVDFMLTSDVYQKPNSFNTKKINDNGFNTGLRDNIFPVYIPKHNNGSNQKSVQESTVAAHSIESHQPPPTTYDEKTHTYKTFLPPSTSSLSHGAYGQPAPFPTHSSSDYGSQTHPTYGPPSYGPTVSYHPQPSYGPPTSPWYPHSHYPTVPTDFHDSAEHQKAHEGFFLKLIKKFDLVLMSKILLKLIIFKKIIKFIAIICLLMFLPMLKKKFMAIGGEEDEDRKYRLLDAYDNVDFRIKEIANFALTAIEGFESNQIPRCVGKSEFYCRVQYMLDQIDIRYPGIKLLGLWFPSLTTTEAPETTFKTSISAENEKLGVNFNDYITDSSETPSSIENEIEEKEE